MVLHHIGNFENNKRKCENSQDILKSDRAFDHSGKPGQMKGNHTNRRYSEIK
jgi:hypothetical protein